MTAASDATASFSGRKTALLTTLRSFFSAIGEGIVAYMESHSRMDQIRRLDARSDRELAALGIRREDIVRHVFRDIIHL